jgi:dihydrofolate synthase/folylpolyglutamate synthase
MRPPPTTPEPPATGDPHSRRNAALDFLLGRINYEAIPAYPYAQRSFKLDRMRSLLTQLGSPDSGLPIVHVAGTKGKGSTSAILAQILQAAGHRVGVFSSPHLHRIEERFCVDRVACDPDTFADLVDLLKPVVARMDREAEEHDDPAMRLTFFELNTAIALLYFARQHVDLAILEVGLGGRLDSTNVCQSVLSIITSISLDHTRQLGSTLEAIAREKAGIVKPGVPVIVGPIEDGPREEILKLAKQRGARWIDASRDLRFAYQPPREIHQGAAYGQLDFELRQQHLPAAGARLKFENAPLGLLGAHQAANAALALAAVAELRRQCWQISDQAILQGLATANLPGRVEVVSRRPTVVMDVAHNTASVKALVDCLQQSFQPQRRLLVCAATRDKDVRGMVRILLPHFERIFATTYLKNPRGVPASRLARICREELAKVGRDPTEVTLAAMPQQAWSAAQQEADPADLICVTGSFFIVAELRPETPGSPPVA